jgi:DNA-binding response OmpR family regulator
MPFVFHCANCEIMKSRILVVDDNEFMLSMMSHILCSQGYEVETLSRAAGLFEHIDTYQPNLIILDAQLPDGDGRDLCSVIKQSKALNHISVVMCSGMADIDDCNKQAGPPDAILPKPFDIDQLIGLVGSSISSAA